MSVWNGLKYNWFQPAESQLNEAAGPNTNRVTAKLKIKGDAATRQKARLALLEYPTLTRVVGSADQGIRYISRNLPVAYPSPFVNNDSADPSTAYLFGNQFLSGEGVGPAGQDGATPPLPLYDYYLYEMEFNERTYDVLPDASVLAPGPIGNGAVAGNPATGTGPAATVQFIAGGSLPAATYFYKITGLSADGETLPGVEGSAAASGANLTMLVTWPALAGALGYKIYRGTVSGMENVQIGPVIGAIPGAAGQFVEDAGNLAVRAASPPTANTTASPLYDPAGGPGGIPIAYPDEGAALALGNGSVGGRYVTRSSRPSSKTVTIPEGFMKFLGTNINVPNIVALRIPCISLQYTHHQIPRSAVPNQAILAALGSPLNVVTFDGWPPGTLLFDGVDKRYYRTALGARVVDLAYTMTAMPNVGAGGYIWGHNAIPRFIPGSPATVDFWPLNSDPSGAGSDVYKGCNYANLFRPDQF